ncbi:MAG TPA: hypothetical protein VH877_15590 [Polyangia bacterium]|jgi:hypothetical protein|nr:hypothetical protein [Polyangia bacterium]
MAARETSEHAHEHSRSVLELNPERAAPRGNALVQPALAMLGKAVRRLSHQVVRYGVVHFYVWDLHASVGLPSPADFVARELEPEEMFRVAARFGRLPGIFHRRLHLGDRCFASFHGKRPVHIRWVARRPVKVSELGLMLCPRPDEIYVYDTFTDPAYRGQHASSTARALMDRVMLAEGVRRGYAYVRADNQNSLRSLGAYHEKLFELSYIGLFGGETSCRGRFSHPLYWPEAVPAPERPLQQGAHAGAEQPEGEVRNFVEPETPVLSATV